VPFVNNMNDPCLLSAAVVDQLKYCYISQWRIQSPNCKTSCCSATVL